MQSSHNQENHAEHKIEYKMPSYWWWGFILFSLFIIFLVKESWFTPRADSGWKIFTSIWIGVFISMMFRSPKSITIDGDELLFSWLLFKSRMSKEDIKNIIKIKMPNRHYIFWITRHNSRLLDLFPICVDWDIKPYYDYGPPKVYNIVVEIEKWFRTEQFDHNKKVEQRAAK